jgi:hypothetical protein
MGRTWYNLVSRSDKELEKALFSPSSYIVAGSRFDPASHRRDIWFMIVDR